MNRVLRVLFMNISFLVANKTLAISASCFNLTHLDNNIISICEKHNKNFLVLEFFSPDCRSCERNISQFKYLEQEISNFAHTRLVSFGNALDTAKFAQRYALSTQIALDKGGKALRAYGISRVPAIVVINNQNKIIHQNTNNLTNKEISKIINLVKQNN